MPQDKCAVSRITEAAPAGWRVEMAWVDHDINPNAMRLGGYTYTTLINRECVQIALSNTAVYMHNNRVWLGDPTVSKSTEITLTGIYTPPEYRQKGYAAVALETLCLLADTLGIKISLEPCPFGRKRGDKSLNRKQLVKWYGKLGFEADSVGGDSIRNCRATTTRVFNAVSTLEA